MVVKEGVFFSADVDESRLKGRFEVDDASEVDVADLGTGIVAFHLILLKAPAVEQGEAALKFLTVQNDLFACFFH